ncbi:HEPN domain-containing protein [Endozoicomonas ascidiicola]|uniref:HEPN domain-containing protein n=1 Tax=Endozoicomonas ascidiicola TaxID=1698521 RepID=UPI00082A0525|nr:HEPN domain-containing protein [Endozoicomonas ascidiicola]
MSKALENFLLAQTDVTSLLKCFDDINGNDDSTAPEVLKRATLIMILTTWETYVEDVASELFDRKFGVLQGSHVGKYMEKNFQTELRRFNTPDSIKTKKLFLDFFGKDVVESWTWANVDQKTACTQLNGWIKKRGDAVHRMDVNISGPHIVRRDELDKCQRFFNELVRKTDETLEGL